MRLSPASAPTPIVIVPALVNGTCARVKSDLVDRVLAAEQADAEMEPRWLRTADELLLRIMLVDRLVAWRGQRAERQSITVPYLSENSSQRLAPRRPEKHDEE